MTGEAMQAMPMSPRQSPVELGNAAVQWACTRRGRTMVLAVVAFVVLLTIGGIHNREVSCSFLPSIVEEGTIEAREAGASVSY